MSIFIDKHELAEKKDIVNPNLLSNTDSFKDFYITGTNTPVNPIKDKLDPLGHVTSHAASVWQQAVHFLDIDTSSVYTLSAFIWLNGTQTIKAICRSSSGNGACQNSATSIDGIKANCWQRISFTFQGFYESHVTFDFEATDGTVDFWVGSYKLEKGSIATQWSPAPQDLVLKSDAQLLEQGISNLIGPVLSSNIKRLGKTDLNNLPSGWCLVTDDTSPNLPPAVSAWCICFTLYVTDTGTDRFQIAIAYNMTGCNIYVRTCGGSPAQWIQWKKISYSA